MAEPGPRYAVDAAPLYHGARTLVLQIRATAAPGAAPVLTLLSADPDRDSAEAIAILEAPAQTLQDMLAA